MEIKKLKSSIINYYIIGLTNFIIYTTLIVVFVNFFNLIISSALACVVTIFYQYHMNKKFVFKGDFRLYKFLIFSFFGFVATIFWAFLMPKELNPILFSFVCALLVSIQNFFLNYLFNDYY